MSFGLKSLIVTLLIFGLFAVALINFSINIAEENGATKNLRNNSAINQYMDALETNLSDAYTTADKADTALTNSSISLTTGYVLIDSVRGIWKTIVTIPKGIYILTVGLAGNTLMPNPTFQIVIYVIGAIFLILFLFAVVKWLTTGSGEDGWLYNAY